jgi:threonylcarbamoyladenosine tRNA methylthiotransferase MtaB
LTGIHLGKYGHDLSPHSSLLDLLARIETAGIVDRVRLSSIEPVELTDALLNYAADSPMMCRHFHIPLQSGDRYILKKMNRPYDPKFFETLVRKINRTMPDAAIGVDVMVGFPGETEDAFANSCSLVADLPVTYLHVFPFSSRPGTAASTYPDHVHPDVIKKRRNHLLKLGRQKKTEFYKKMVGSTLDVLIENKCDAKTKQLSGVSSNYVRVFVDGDDRLKNSMIPCQITEVISPEAVRGKPGL